MIGDLGLVLLMDLCIDVQVIDNLFAISNLPLEFAIEIRRCRCSKPSRLNY